MGQLETDVECHRRIVAAASRLATDKNTNKSVRKKRQKDLLAARQKLNRLEQGLQQMRHSASKPDISSIASDGSNNSWNVSSHSAPMTMAMTKSCPTTPRGSIPDLRKHNQDYDDEKSEIEDHSIEERVSRRAPSALSRHSLQQRYSGISSSSTSSGSDSIGGGLPPRPKPSSVYTQTPIDCMMMMEMSSPLYENVGYRSTSYRSSYRQAHYPTIQDEHTQQQIQKDRKRAQSAHQIIGAGNAEQNRTCTYSVPLNDAKQKFIDMDFDEQNDVTPTADYPMVLNHRLTTSISCQGGFATASLDRRKSNVQRIPMNGSSDDMIRQSVTTRITTFPVAQPQNTVILAGGKPYSTSELPRFPHPPPVARVTHLPRGSLPPYSGSPSGGGAIPKTNPQMEALLSYYKQQTNQQQQQQKNGQKRTTGPKTATIV
ncbi:unnamed protein product [Caenorhabditis angaria]|uniref:Uncharacterized protein n=1 Tax=Caenorhabditis angaria TaxID=860376 RepID=A0A9P1IQ16_9PELO|nr:unnamed protein product [Caenorhabditis angaria]